MIYIATHKQFNDLKLKDYCPIQVGSYRGELLGYQRDDVGDNISNRNANFCELTGLYWIWKNSLDEYKGLVHYRRYFGKRNFTNSIKDIYSYQELKALLKDCDIVLPYIEYFKENARDELLKECCTVEIFNNLRSIVSTKHADYLKAFDNYFKNNESYLFNMMFTDRETFDSYCNWLFDILFELEKVTDLADLNTYQQRLYGFLSERLLNVWVKKNGLKTKHVGVIQTELNNKELLVLRMRRMYHRITFKER